MILCEPFAWLKYHRSLCLQNYKFSFLGCFRKTKTYKFDNNIVLQAWFSFKFLYYKMKDCFAEEQHSEILKSCYVKDWIFFSTLNIFSGYQNWIFFNIFFLMILVRMGKLTERRILIKFTSFIENILYGLMHLFCFLFFCFCFVFVLVFCFVDICLKLLIKTKP